MSETDIDLIVCNDCNKLLGNLNVISNSEYEKLISSEFNHAYPLETTELVVKCKGCGKLIFTLRRLSHNVLSSSV